MKPLILCTRQPLVIPGVRTRVPVYHAHLFACADTDLLADAKSLAPNQVLSAVLEKIGEALGKEHPGTTRPAEILPYQVEGGQVNYICVLPDREGALTSHAEAAARTQELAAALKAKTCVEFLTFPDTSPMQAIQSELISKSPLGIASPSIFANFSKIEPALNQIRTALHYKKLAVHAVVAEEKPTPRRLRR